MYPKRVPWVRIPLSPPPSLRLQRLCTRYPRPTQKLPRFRGVLGGGTAESEPETASSGPTAGSWSRLSLLPSLAVRIRFRFAPQGIPEVRIPFAPPTSLRLRGSLSRGARQQGNSRGFAGFWGGRSQEAEPETGHWPRGSPPERGSSPTGDWGGSVSHRAAFWRWGSKMSVEAQQDARSSSSQLARAARAAGWRRTARPSRLPFMWRRGTWTTRRAWATSRTRLRSSEIRKPERTPSKKRARSRAAWRPWQQWRTVLPVS